VLTILVNGDEREVADDTTVASLLRELGLDSRHVAVERNREIVARTCFEGSTLRRGDKLEIVTFVGGG
jgi:thiamine biosynthesis protein ThiS